MVKVKRRIAGDLFLIVMACVALAPLLWALMTSLKVTKDIMSAPPVFFEWTPTFEHYRNVLGGSKALRFVLNTFIVATCTSAAAVVVGLIGGYAAARLQFKFKSMTLLLILGSGMLPGIAILVALYKLGAQIGLLDSYVYICLIFLAWQLPTVLWMMRSFVLRTSVYLEEAAMIDGCTRFGAFIRVTVPQLRAGIAAAAMIVFVFVWNDWLVASIMLSSSDKSLIQPGLFRYIGDSGVRWGDFMAYAMIGTLPIIAAFVALRKQFISGLAAGATKG